MCVLILGLGVSGKAVKAFCEKRGDQVFIYDDHLAPKSVCLDQVDLVIKSPGIPLMHPYVVAAQKRGIAVVGEIDLALEELKRKTLYAITGSNGKTTTALLTEHLLKAAGKSVAIGGNIGTPLISLVESEADYIVVELSSFQLESMRIQPLFDAAVILNITPNHLDRHSSFQAYVAAKSRLALCMKKGAPFFVDKDSADRFMLAGEIFDVETISPLSYNLGIGFYSHDCQNIAAAKALTGLDGQGLETFAKPSHRLEFVRTYQGITFINDSKATSVDAVIKAVEAIEQPIMLIAGGVDKGTSYRAWLPVFQGRVKKMWVMGNAAARMYEELTPAIEVEKILSIEEGVQKATKEAQSEMTVLLSPGCSSFDHFKNYEHRGDTFKELVYALEEVLQ